MSISGGERRSCRTLLVEHIPPEFCSNDSGSHLWRRPPVQRGRNSVRVRHLHFHCPGNRCPVVLKLEACPPNSILSSGAKWWRLRMSLAKRRPPLARFRIGVPLARSVATEPRRHLDPARTRLPARATTSHPSCSRDSNKGDLALRKQLLNY